MTDKRKYFGTDGIRGEVGGPHINPEFMVKLGWSIGKALANGNGAHVLIGKDTRISGYMLESSLEAGLSSAGVNVTLCGPVPTPAIAYLTRSLRLPVGIVISASHNPYYDNGIKLFSGYGTKLPDATELMIEQYMEQPLTTVPSKDFGKVYRMDEAGVRYIEFCKSRIPYRIEFKGMKIVIDCAHGATYNIAPHVFREMGAQVIVMGASPDGCNINDHCGATRPEALATLVRTEEADLGIAFDGDGDRCIMVDHAGDIIDGDELLFIIANYYQAKGHLKGGVVGTLMTNMSLELAFKERGIEFVRTKVGDRYVFEEMERRGWLLGGESSGHIIVRDSSTTGDGIVTAIKIMYIMHKTRQSLHALNSVLRKFPQKMVNVRCDNPQERINEEKIQAAVKQAEKELADKGRVLIRASGTEPYIRVMVEAKDQKLVQSYLARLVAAVEQVVA